MALVLVALGAGTFAAPAAADLRSELYSDTALTQLVRVDSDPLINFNWPDGTGPEGVGDTFSMRWTGRIQPEHSEDYTFVVTRDDNVRLWVGGQLVLADDWSVGHTGTIESSPVALEAGRLYDLKVEFADGFGDAEIRLDWRSASQAEQTVPASRLLLPAPPPPPPAEDKPTPPAKPKTPSDSVPAGVPAPVAGRSVGLAPATGSVRVRLPGSRRYVDLDGLSSIPVGAVVDARRGAVNLRAEGAAGKPQTLAAGGAVFRLSQPARGKRVVTLALRHGKLACGPVSKRAAVAKRRRSARLWAKGKGKFRTRGRYGAATVRGTTWSVEDRCRSTITRVRTGVVAVDDFVRHRRKLVRAGERYVARARARR